MSEFIQIPQSKPHDIRVITFNILSQDCVTNEYFPFVQKHYLDFEFRLVRLKQLLSSWIKVNFIICLQELSEQWKNELVDFFATNRYSFEWTIYPENKMGVGIAYPSNHYQILQKDEFTCGDYVGRHFSQLFNIEPAEDRKQIIEELKNASKSKNVMLSLLLNCKYKGTDTGVNLIISTYHMPCKFLQKYFLISHIHAIKNRLSELKTQNKADSVVLTGDFNINPSKLEYLYLTNSFEGEYLLNNVKDVYSSVGLDLFSGVCMRSAYLSINLAEPKYTNVSMQKDSTFIDCLDYILVNDSVGVRSCTVGLTTENYIPYPNGLCPSDHLPLSASLFIH